MNLLLDVLLYICDLKQVKSLLFINLLTCCSGLTVLLFCYILQKDAMISQMLYAGLTPLVLMTVFSLYLRYKYPEGILGPFLMSFFYGIIASLVVVLLQIGFEKLGLAELKSLKRTAFHAFVVVGFLSQAAVQAVVLLFYFRNRIIKTPADGLVYTWGTALGVSLLSGLHIALSKGSTPYYLQLVLTFPFALLVTSSMIGFFSGLAQTRKNALVDLITGLSGASFFLGLYMFCLYTNEQLLWYLSGIATVSFSLLFIYKALNTDWLNRKV